MRETIDGAKRFLFESSTSLQLLVAQEEIRNTVIEKLHVLNDDDFFAAAELIITIIEPTYKVPMWKSRDGIEWRVGVCLPVLGLSQLRDLAGLLGVGPTAKNRLESAA